ncbi:MAG: site-specific integrase [Thermoleophilaceae bacterium]
MAEVRAPRAVGERLTIAELGRRYMSELERRGRKRATLVAVELALRVHLEPFFGERSVDSIKPEDVEDLVSLMETNGLKPKSIRNYIGTLSALFAYAQGPRRRWASSNPCAGVDLPAVEQSAEIRFLDLDEVDALVAAVAPGPFERIDRALFLTAAMTGLRQGELLALRWRDVDWTAGRVRVRQNYVLGEFGTPKSRRSTRSVPLADKVAGELERLYQSRYAADEAGDRGDELVFTTTGDPLKRSAILERFRAALGAAGLDQSRRFHDLRHTFGTRMAAAGVALRTLQEWMGHRDLATTQIYADYAPSAHESALVEAAFQPRGTNPGTNLSDSQVT